MKVSCVIPEFNESATITKVLSTLKKVKTISEIIVVDDGSSDNTYRLAKSAGVRVLRHRTNKGKGRAIKTGFLHANGDIILFLDADIYNLTPRKVTSII